MEMLFREAITTDVPRIQIVRNAVKENVLSDPSRVTDQDCIDYLVDRGKGWVCEVNNSIVGFAIADLIENNIWALFVHPDVENKSIGKTLHKIMMQWYFNQGKEVVWLSTGPNTRAVGFYRKVGWRETGLTSGGEVKFEMTADEWKRVALLQ